MLLKEDYPDDPFVFILVVFSRLDILEELTSFTAILPDEPPSIPHKEFTTFIAELTSCDVGLIVILGQLREDLL